MLLQENILHQQRIISNTSDIVNFSGYFYDFSFFFRLPPVIAIFFLTYFSYDENGSRSMKIRKKV